MSQGSISQVLVKKCYVNYLGCEKRKLDAQRVVNFLRANGYSLASQSADAEIVVFLTCAFCNKYEKFSIAKLDKIYQQKQAGATFIIGGCLPEINPAMVNTYPDAIRVPVRDLDSLGDILHLTVPMRDIPDPNTTIFDQKVIKTSNSLPLKSPAEQEYEAAKRGYKIRINWGCLGHCSYCVTKLAEKSLTSKPLETILDEFRGGLAAGYTSFFFTGGDTGAYGLDQGSSIVELLCQIFNEQGSYKVHFHDFGVQWLCSNFPALLPIFQANQAKLGCFCFPIQSGSNRILRLMRRSYTMETLYTTLLSLKAQVPALKLGTHFIVGFPGETEEDFQLTTQFLQDIPFDFVEVYRYTDHIRAESHNFPSKILPEIILDRNTRLEATFRAKFT